MSKVIIFCADGTWNGPADLEHDAKAGPTTNVFKLFLSLAGQDTAGSTLLEKEQERDLVDADGTTRQTAKYLHGVGDSGNFLVKALGGAVGGGLITRIVRGYTFISRNYREGDRIFLIGFSRGAYTARALAGLIAARGLLDATKIDLDDKETAYRLGSAVWYDNRRRAGVGTDFLGRLEQRLLDLPGFFSRPPSDDKLIRAPIEGVAVWDTVGALGIPEFTVKLERVDAFQFADLKLSPVVKHGIHAIAVDEQRNDFVPTLWDPDPRITQALFPGAHADVGGGYPAGDESGISDASLVWMVERLRGLGVQFAIESPYRARYNASGTAHQPWTHGQWPFLPHSSRTFPPGLCLTKCLLDRLAGGPVIVEPGREPADYVVGNLGVYLNGKLAAAGVSVC